MRSDLQRRLRRIVLLLACAGLLGPASADDDRLVTAQADTVTGPVPLFADIRVHTPAEVISVLERLEAVAVSDQGFPDHDPVILVLHGDEAATFTRENYRMYKDAVDRAARLEAFGLLDVRICEQWMQSRGVMQSDLPSFVDTVPDGMAEERRLEREGYVRF